MKPLSVSTTALVSLALIACSGCSRLVVEWTPGQDEIALVASGPKEAAVLLVLAGPPNGPHTMPGDPRIWSTVGPDKPWAKGGVEVARVPFDAAGMARASVKAEAVGTEAVLVQAVALSRSETGRAIAVSACVAVSRKDGALVVRPHVVLVLLSPIWWSLGTVAALVVLGVLSRRIRVPWRKVRPVSLAVVLTAAAFLLLTRARAPADATPGPWPDPALPLLPRGIPLPEARDPVDRLTRPGFRQLVEGVRAAAPEGGTVSIVPAAAEGAPWHDSWQAAWLLWPVRALVVDPKTDPFERRGLYLTLDDGPKRAGARVLFKNRAGCLWSVEAGEPK